MNRLMRSIIAGCVVVGFSSTAFSEKRVVSQVVTTSVLPTEREGVNLLLIDLSDAVVVVDPEDIVSSSLIFEPVVQTPGQTVADSAGWQAVVPVTPNWNCPPNGQYVYGRALRQRRRCPAFWEHRTGLFGEFQYLTARGANVAYATPVDGMGANAVPIGSVGVADSEYDSGFTMGFWIRLKPISSVGFRYSFFDSKTRDRISLPGGAGFVRGDLVHPNTVNVAADSLIASASYDINFDLIDAVYRRLIYKTDSYALNYIVGFRYGSLEQNLNTTYAITGVTVVQTEIDFDGFGPRMGLDAERQIGHGFLVYARGFANFLVGEFQADYSQSNVFAGRQATIGFDDDRLVSLLELELGFGWQSRCGCVRLFVGSYAAAWFNTITTPRFIDAVQRNDFTDMHETLTFGGYTARLEIRW